MHWMTPRYNWGRSDASKTGMNIQDSMDRRHRGDKDSRDSTKQHYHISDKDTRDSTDHCYQSDMDNKQDSMDHFHRGDRNKRDSMDHCHQSDVYKPDSVKQCHRGDVDRWDSMKQCHRGDRDKPGSTEHCHQSDIDKPDSMEYRYRGGPIVRSHGNGHDRNSETADSDDENKRRKRRPLKRDCRMEEKDCVAWKSLPKYLAWSKECIALRPLLSWQRLDNVSLPYIIKHVNNSKYSNGSYVNTILPTDIVLNVIRKHRGLYVDCKCVRINRNDSLTRKYTGSHSPMVSAHPETFGPHLALPMSYNGWFEIVSEDGRSVKCVYKLSELIRQRRLHVVSRDAFYGYVYPTFKGKKLMFPVGTEVMVSTFAERPEFQQICTESRLFVYCTLVGAAADKLKRKDHKLQSIFIPINMEYKFSPVAGITNITGLHRVTDIVSKYRFPLTVKLILGKGPENWSETVQGAEKIKFSRYIRLTRAYKITNVYVSSFEAENSIYRMPIGCTGIESHSFLSDSIDLKIMRMADQLCDIYQNTLYVPLQKQTVMGSIGSRFAKPNSNSGSTTFHRNPKRKKATEDLPVPGLELEKYIKHYTHKTIRRHKSLGDLNNVNDFHQSPKSSSYQYPGDEIDRLYEKIRGPLIPQPDDTRSRLKPDLKYNILFKSDVDFMHNNNTNNENEEDEDTLHKELLQNNVHKITQRPMHEDPYRFQDTAIRIHQRGKQASQQVKSKSRSMNILPTYIYDGVYV